MPSTPQPVISRTMRRAIERRARKAARKAAGKSFDKLVWSAAHPIFEKNHLPEPVPTPAEQLKTKLLSEGRLAANRANALLSTGPRTAIGRATSSMNRLTHGLVFGAQFKLLTNEDPELYGLQRKQFIEEHQPATPGEHLLVERMAQHNWLYERAVRMQNNLFGEITGMLTPNDEKMFSLYARYATTHERAFYKCLALLQQQRKDEQKTEDGFVRQKQDEDLHVFKLRAAKAKAEIAEIRLQNAIQRQTLPQGAPKELRTVSQSCSSTSVDQNCSLS